MFGVVTQTQVRSTQVVNMQPLDRRHFGHSFIPRRRLVLDSTRIAPGERSSQPRHGQRPEPVSFRAQRGAQRRAPLGRWRWS